MAAGALGVVAGEVVSGGVAEVAGVVSAVVAVLAGSEVAGSDVEVVDARPLCRRLAAIRSAREDLPRQAKRYARWRARPPETRRPKRLDSLRTGPPPGLRRRPTHEVEEILAECHWLSRHAAASDTS